MQSVRTAGALLHLSSLPGPFAVGVMGREAELFVLQLQRMGFHYWQVLPLCPVDDTGSPYCSCSANAGNLALIDPRRLMEEGLLTEREVRESVYPGSVYAADYAFALRQRLHVLRLAFSRLTDDDKDQLTLFAQQNSWVADHALYCALKGKNGEKPWWEWPKEEAVYETAKQNAASLQAEIDFHVFCQFVFFKQYRSLKAFANAHGVFLIGDMPIYVSRDSVDVWSAPQLFQLDDKTLLPKKVAGVPPDYFSEDGQLWGNPLYDWEYHKKTGYAWWIRRMEACFALYDVVRIDHFRGFDEYYNVPYGDKTAEFGHWEKGPGYDLFAAMKKKLGDRKIIAEDLGLITPGVRKLVKKTGYPGMKVLEFAFDSNEDNDHIPHNFERNCVVYTGTHDNDTAAGWFAQLNRKDQVYTKKYMNIKSAKHIAWDLIRLAMGSVADTVIIQMQDYLELGNEARINIPSTLGNNWNWRMQKGACTGKLAERIREMTELYGRGCSES